MSGYWIVCKKCYIKCDNLESYENHTCINHIEKDYDKIKTELEVAKQTIKILSKFVGKKYQIDLSDIIDSDKQDDKSEKRDKEIPARKKLQKPRFSKLRKTDVIISDHSEDECIPNNKLKIYNKIEKLYDLTEDELEERIGMFLYNQTDETNVLEFKSIRYKILRYISVSSYNEVLRKFYSKFNRLDIFTPFEIRILQHNQMCKYLIDLDEIEKYKIGIEQMQKEKLINSLFDKNKIISYFLDPRLGFYDIEIILSIFFENNKEVIVYLPKKPSELYSFYTLESSNESYRKWRLDCRLENLGTDMAEQINEYCCNYFKKLYYSIFKNNIFNTHFLEYSDIHKLELMQLLKNIYRTTNNIKFCKMICDIVSKECVLLPTDFDSFNITSDDKTQKTRFKSFDESVISQFFEVFKNLFDSIDTSNMLEFVETFISGL